MYSFAQMSSSKTAGAFSGIRPIENLWETEARARLLLSYLCGRISNMMNIFPEIIFNQHLTHWSGGCSLALGIEEEWGTISVSWQDGHPPTSFCPGDWLFPCYTYFSGPGSSMLLSSLKHKLSLQPGKNCCKGAWFHSVDTAKIFFWMSNWKEANSWPWPWRQQH